MKRIYYLFKDTIAARGISDDLMSMGMNNGQLHFLNRDFQKLDALDVHRTNIFDEKDIGHSGLYGALAGLACGLLFTVVLGATSLSHYLSLQILLFVWMLFAFFGGWAGGIVGISKDNHHIERFHNAIEKGDTLLMLDTYSEKEEEKAKDVMFNKHKEATYQGEDAHYREFL
ncbi:MAG: hypothetical protein MI976_11545 [Pseudomonadales bacterium]|nr:hypothetical protein [Pseudomonadales bacterium]